MGVAPLDTELLQRRGSINYYQGVTRSKAAGLEGGEAGEV